MSASKEDRPAASLYTLEELGVPAFDIVAEAIGKSVQETRRLASADRLRSGPLFDLLTHFYMLRYKGMSEKLLLKRRAHAQ